MKYTLIIVTALISITATAYLVTKPLDNYKHTPQQTMDEWRIKYEEQKKQLQFLEMWKTCSEAHGDLIVDSNGNAACALKRDRWLTQ